MPRQLRKPLAGLLLLAALTVTAGCGKKGPPLPPLRFVPATVKDLIASQQGTRILLNFAYPKVTAAGQSLGTVTEVDVYEVTRPVPGVTAPPVPTPAATAPATPATPGAPAAPGSKAPTTPATPPSTTATPPATTPAAPTAPALAPATSAPAVPATSSPTPATPATPAPPAAPPGTPPAAPPAATPAAPTSPAASATAATPATPAAAEEPPPLPGREYTSSAKVRLKLKGAEVGAATQGDRIVVELPYPEKTELHYFTVKTLGPHGDPSGYSNQVVILPRPAPAPPADTKMTARADGVEVTWTEPAAAPGSGRVIGYNIYRRYSQTKGFGPALHAAAATDRSYVDTSAQYGQGYIYTVTAVAHRDPVVESAIKTEGEIKYIDRFPPPVPREPVALVEPGRVRVVWRGSEAIDLAGYKVYRLDTKKAKGEYELLTATPITEVEYTDSTVKVGGTYAYRITAIDQLGNESEPVEVRATAQ